MTNLEAIQVGARRAGLSDTNATYLGWARTYLNTITKEVDGDTTWWWKFKSGSYTTVASQRLYDAGTDVQQLIWGANQTRDEPLGIKPSSMAMKLDPPLTETGSPEFLYVWGVAADDGQMQIGTYPIDSTASETIAYLYYAFTPDFTDANDDDSLNPYIHPTVQPAVPFGIARLLKQQEGDEEGAEVEEAEMQKILNRARRANGQVLGEYLSLRNPAKIAQAMGYQNLRSLTIQEGSL